MLVLLLLGCSPLKWTPCGAQECATVWVPLDPADPKGETLPLALRRAPARDRSERIGTLVLHFGGPGVASTTAWDRGLDAADLLAGGTAPLADRFDVLTVDWRGTGPAGLDCLDAAAWDALQGVSLAPETDAEWDALSGAVDAFQAGCFAAASEGELATLGADVAADDLDLLRDALREDQLTLLTWSYGTSVAAAYARRHPDGLRAAVLDSPTGAPDREAFLTGQAVGFEDALDQFFAWCADTRCAFARDGEDAADLGVAWEALRDQLDAEPLDEVDGDVLGWGSLSAQYGPWWGWPWLADALSAARDGDGTVLAPAAGWSGLPAGPDDGGLLSAYTATLAMDLPVGDRSLADLRAWTEAALPAAPRMARAVTCFDAFGFGWPVPAPAPGPGGEASTGPLLFVVTEHDAATPAAQGEATATALAPAAPILRQGGTGHAATGWSGCAGQAALAFLLDPGAAVPASCPAVTIE